VNVTWLVNASGVLPDFDRTLADALTTSLTAQGVTLVEGEAVSAVQAGEEGVVATLADGRTFQAERAFVAIGRRADVAGLNLDAAGLNATGAGLAVDAVARTAVPHIFAAGDVTGPPLIANKAVAQARIAGLTAAGQAAQPPKPEAWIEAAYSHPQVAQVGLTPDRAAAQGVAVTTRTVPFGQALKPYLTDTGLDGPGFVTLVTDPNSGRVLGGLAFGDHAADVLAPVALAIQADLTGETLAATFPAYPTMGEVGFMAAR
jgi:dihydrolipoamide dehydrogenase